MTRGESLRSKGMVNLSVMNHLMDCGELGASRFYTSDSVNRASHTRGPPLSPMVVGDLVNRPHCRRFISRTRGNFARCKISFVSVCTLPQSLEGRIPGVYGRRQADAVVRNVEVTQRDGAGLLEQRRAGAVVEGGGGRRGGAGVREELQTCAGASDACSHTSRSRHSSRAA